MNPLATRIWQHGRDRQNGRSATRVIRTGVLWAVPWLLLSALASHPQQWASAEEAVALVDLQPELSALTLETAVQQAEVQVDCPARSSLLRQVLRRSADERAARRAVGEI